MIKLITELIYYIILFLHRKRNVIIVCFISIKNSDIMLQKNLKYSFRSVKPYLNKSLLCINYLSNWFYKFFGMFCKFSCGYVMYGMSSENELTQSLLSGYPISTYICTILSCEDGGVFFGKNRICTFLNFQVIRSEYVHIRS